MAGYRQIASFATVLSVLSCGVVLIMILTGERMEGEGRMATAKRKLSAVSTNVSRAVGALGTAAKEVAHRKGERLDQSFEGVDGDQNLSLLNGAIVNKQLACVHEKQRVEEALFRGLSWRHATHRLAKSDFNPPEWCNLSSFAEIVWASRAEAGNDMDILRDAGARPVAKAKMQVWLNDIEKARFSQEVEHAFIGWMQSLGQRTGKLEWRVALVGDSTLRGVASAWIRMLAGPQQWLNAFDRWYTRISIVVETIPPNGEGAVRLEVLYHKNWGWGVYPGPTQNLLREMPRVDIFVWNIGLHSLWSPLPLFRRYKKGGQSLRSGSLHADTLEMSKALPSNATLVYMLTNSICPCNVSRTTEGIDDEGGYLFNREGSQAQNLMARDVMESSQKNIRVIDSFNLTDGRCSNEYTSDGYHFASLDIFKVLSVLLDFASWPSRAVQSGADSALSQAEIS